MSVLVDEPPQAVQAKLFVHIGHFFLCLFGIVIDLQLFPGIIVHIGIFNIPSYGLLFPGIGHIAFVSTLLLTAMLLIPMLLIALRLTSLFTAGLLASSLLVARLLTRLLAALRLTGLVLVHFIALLGLLLLVFLIAHMSVFKQVKNSSLSG